MKSLAKFINEAISKRDVTSNAKLVDDLTPILTELGLAKTRVKTYNRLVKKVLGTNKSVYVMSTLGTQKSNMDALAKVIDKGQVRRDAPFTINNARDAKMYEIDPIDVASSNEKFHKEFNKKNFPDMDPKEIADMFKKNMQYDLENNNYIKKVGITDDVKKQIIDICNRFEKEINDATYKGDGWAVKNEEGVRMTMFPSLFVVGKTVIKAMCIGDDTDDYNGSKFKEKMRGNKCMIIFSKEDIDNLKDEA